MLVPDREDSDAPIGAARLRKGSPRMGRRPGNAGGAWKPFAGAVALALVAAGLATLMVQFMPGSGGAPQQSAALAPAPEPGARSSVAAGTPNPAGQAGTPAGRVETTNAAPPAPEPPQQQAALASAPATSPAPATAPAPATTPAPARSLFDEEPAPAPSLPGAAEPTAGPADPSAVASIPTGALKMSGPEIISSLERGEAKLKVGDIAAARRYFERVALAGDARGATAMGRTYDPEVLRKLPIIGLEPNPAEAASWYDRARTLKAGP